MKQLGFKGKDFRAQALQSAQTLVTQQSCAVWIPGILLSSLNSTFRGITRGALYAKTAKAKKQIADVTLVLNSKLKTKPELPLIITVERVAKGTLDAHDNLPGACKHVVDAIAEWLGVDDSDSRLAWRYAQSKSATIGVAIRFDPWP